MRQGNKLTLSEECSTQTWQAFRLPFTTKETRQNFAWKLGPESLDVRMNIVIEGRAKTPQQRSSIQS